MIAEPIEPMSDGELDEPFIAEPVPTREPAGLTARQVLAGMRNRMDQLWAFDVEYDFLQKSFVGDENLVPFGRYREAFSREKRFKTQSGQHLADCPTVFFPAAIWAWSGSLQQDFQACDPSAYIKQEKSDWVDRSFYLHSACLPTGSIEEELARSKVGCCNHTFVSDLFGPRQNWMVRPHCELVDESPCYVLTDGDRCTFWIDPSLGFSPRLLENSTGKTINGRRQTTNRTAFRDYTLVRDGFHVPWQLMTIGYDGSQDRGTRWGKEFSLITHKVRRLSINEDVDEDLFTLKYPAGTVVRDSAHTRFYRIGENDEEIKLGDWN
jgi:hypothetical protein